ncbi:unnamed protein product [Blepharisma stoltei]|uniref:Tyrosine-protein phosphatase domain-containing protein n=1 Tax=Blepharisma stoltei TaxID=1481888 RepID=A0AAU9IJK5_9CILI|nr:unnamed protein product [Blepharisma stoltei]
MLEDDLIGAIKIKDGLFIGDEYSSQDLEFVVSSKVTHIINCAATQLPNHWEPIGISYLSFPWQDLDSQIIFDANSTSFDECYDFIEEAVDACESVLIHSVLGKSRCICVVAGYIMKKYRWTLVKTLEFLNSRRPNLELRQNFVNQLVALEHRLTRQGFGPKSSTWNELGEDAYIDSEELLLRNTYINAQVGPFIDYKTQKTEEKQFLINWSDCNTNNKSMLEDIAHPSSKNPIENGYAILKSCIKGSQNECRALVQGIKRAKKPETAPLKIKNLDDLGSMLEDVSNTKMRRSACAVKRDNSPSNSKGRAQSARAKEEVENKPIKKQANLVFEGVGNIKLQLKNEGVNENLEAKMQAKGRRPVTSQLRPPSPIVRNGNKIDLRQSNSGSLPKRPKPIWK